MMVETILESSQDFGMSNGVLPQWKRELLQRRAARSRPAAPPPAPPPPPPPPADNEDEDEELRYGPGIVKRLKSRYLSLALRDAPRRRPSVLRRATSLEHLLDERPPPAPRAHTARPPRPVSVAVPPAAHSHAHNAVAAAAALPPRRDSVKRARSVDALTRLEPRDEPQPPPSPPPCAPRTPVARAARPPRRPTPLLRDAERPPPDVVRSTLRKFESAPTRRAAPAARVSAVLRGLEAAQPRTSTPEPRARSPSPAAVDLSIIEDADAVATGESTETKPVSRAALDGIARAGSTIRYSFETPRPGSHLPPLAAASNPVLLGRVRPSASPRRVGVIRPMPAPTLERATSSPIPPPDQIEKIAEAMPMIATPPPADGETGVPPRLEKREPPPSAFVEPIPRSPPDERPTNDTGRERSPPEDVPDRREPSPESIETKPDLAKIENVAKPEFPKAESGAKPEPLVNGHAGPERPPQSKFGGAFSRIGAAEIERAWRGEKKVSVEPKEKKDVLCGGVWPRGGGVAPGVPGVLGIPGVAGVPGAGRKVRPPPPAATSVVFNFSNRKDVPDYIENDGIILRANRRDKIKAGDPGVVVLRPEALVRSESDSDGEGDCGPPSPCGVRFINDNVLINGRSSMPTKPNKDRISKLKLQFDDSLTRTFEYPSETSLCEESPSAAGGAGAGAGSAPAHLAPLAANTHIASAALSRYTPSKTLADQFELGVTRHEPTTTHRQDVAGRAEAGAEGGAGTGDVESETCTENAEAEAEAEAEAGDARPCGADAARSWSEARTIATDLLF